MIEHGKATQGLSVPTTDPESYEKYIQGYIADEFPTGKHTVRFNLASGISVADSAGNRISAKTPPPRGLMRFIHKVVVNHEWKSKAGRTRKETHAYYFDVTRVIVDARKFKLEAAAGIKREE